MRFDFDAAVKQVDVWRVEGRDAELLDALQRALYEVDHLLSCNPRQQTIDRLRFERDKLRSEVVRMRGEQEHDYEALLEGDLGETMQFRCKNCGRQTSTPTVAYFDPCSKQMTLNLAD